MTIVSIHQPGYLPWLGFFKKILSSDIFVFLDDAQYVHRQWHNRNMIRTSQGSIWLSVPVNARSDSNINEVKIDYGTNWPLTHKKSIKFNYSKARHFEKYWGLIEEFYAKKFDLLLDLNMEIIRYIIKELGITTKTIFSSELKIKEKGSDRNLSICKALGADTYLSGTLGVNYLKVDDFTKNNISIQFQNFQHPVYGQCYDPFIPNMATIDLLFNEGENSIEILRNAKNF
jgi:hypothetical protein